MELMAVVPMSDVLPLAKLSSALLMASRHRAPLITPPKTMAHIMSQIVLSIPLIPEVDKSSDSMLLSLAMEIP